MPLFLRSSMLTIIRLNQGNSECTLGELAVEGSTFTCKTLELPWLNNTPSVSCIPVGKYFAYKRKKASGTVIELIDVPNRTYIQIHPGNYTRQIEGCILPGVAHIDIDGDGIMDVTSSRSTMNKLLNELPEEFYITIKEKTHGDN